MEHLFSPNPWNPVGRPYFSAHHRRPSAPPTAAAAKPKVVSIPVQYVASSEAKKPEKKRPSEVERMAAAATIQRVFRGFVVRKNVEAVRRLAEEVEEMERRVASEEEVIRREEKERLRVNEMLMRLLLKLDSVRGVRDYRRKVIRRVIALQDRVDAISAARTLETPRSVGEEPGVIVAGDESVEGEDQGLEIATDPMVESSSVDVVEGALEGEATSEWESPASDSMEEDPNSVELVSDVVPESPAVKSLAGEQSTEEIDPQTSLPPAVETRDEGANALKADEGRMDKAPMEQILENSAIPTKGAPETGNMAEERIADVLRTSSSSGELAMGMREVMERVAAESERLKDLVAELCERSAQQCRLMGGLAERVEHLERVVQRMEHAKKKRRAGSTLSSAADKKCGLKKQ